MNPKFVCVKCHALFFRNLSSKFCPRCLKKGIMDYEEYSVYFMSSFSSVYALGETDDQS